MVLEFHLSQLWSGISEIKHGFAPLTSGIDTRHLHHFLLLVMPYAALREGQQVCSSP